MAKNYYAGLDKESKKIQKAQNKYADFAEEVAKLPYQLQDEYRKSQDPELGKKINVAEQNVMGGAITALDKYKDISDPTTRRALAEKFQSGLSIDYKNLTDERTRREGVYADYITKWTGLYGAEAAKQEAKLNAKVESWNRSMNLASAKQSQANWQAEQDESKRRWDYEQAHKGSGKGGKDFLSDAISTLQSSTGKDGKIDPNVYQEVRNVAIAKGYSKDEFDKNFSNMLGSHEYSNLGIATKEESPTTSLAKMKLKNAQTLEDLKGKADKGDEGYYWSGKTIKKKKKGWFGIDWLSPDETIETFK
jgi:hypothetical protein